MEISKSTIKRMLESSTGIQWKQNTAQTVSLELKMQDGSFFLIMVTVLAKPKIDKPMRASVSCSDGIALSLSLNYGLLTDVSGYIDSIAPVTNFIGQVDRMRSITAEQLLDEIHAKGYGKYSSASILADPFRFADYDRTHADYGLVHAIVSKAIGG